MEEKSGKDEKDDKGILAEMNGGRDGEIKEKGSKDCDQETENSEQPNEGKEQK